MNPLVVQDFLSKSPEQFCTLLAELGVRRAAVFDVGHEGLEVSHPRLEPLARWLREESADFGGHSALFLERGQRTGVLLGAFLHAIERGQAAGGVRLWRYRALADFLTDGLRLSLGMARKNALAGLWWGGGKGVIAHPGSLSPQTRQQMYEDYGAFVTSLRGAYVTAEDVGTTPEDMADIYRTTRFMTCAPPSVGGSGNPSPSTARGVVCAMEAALEHRGLGGFEGKTIAVQGVGNVGATMVRLLLERGVARVVAVDVSETHVQSVRRASANPRLEVSVVEPGDARILSQQCDILAPNALGGVLNPASIATLRTPIVCGAANNQLLDPARDGALLRDRGVLYVPDYLANRMGIVNCANEQYGTLEHDPAIVRHYSRDWPESVYCVAKAVFARAESQGSATSGAADALADERSVQPHPLFPGRTRALLESLRQEGWANGPSDRGVSGQD